ncbi:Protein SRN-1 [Aphelenchoides avenae]|nr:Protein SRN-1 [Aphelenchus avenae]
MLTRNWYDVTLSLLAVIPVLSQVYVIWMVIKKSPKSMAEYRFFLCLYTAWDMLFTIVIGVLLHPSPLFPAPSVYANGLSTLFGTSGVDVTLHVGFYAAANVVMDLDYCLLYRMVVIMEDKRPYQWFVSKMGYVMFWALGVLVSVCVVFALSNCFLVQRNHLEHFSDYPGVVDLIPRNAIVIYMEKRLASTHWIMMGLFGGLLVSELVSLGVVFKVLRTLRRNAGNFSKKTYRLHLQLTALLLLQLSTPIIFVVFPLVVTIFSVVLETTLTQMHAKVGFLLLALYAPVNSLLVIVFVGPYRRYTASQVLTVVRALVKPFANANVEDASASRPKVVVAAATPCRSLRP